MDRIEAMETFIAVVDEGGFAAAARRLGHSPAAVTRAIAFLEAHLNARLLHRTTRSVGLTEAGQRFVEACRRVLADMKEAELMMSGERAAPRGVLVVTAPVSFGQLRVRPHVDKYLESYPTMQVRLLLLDRVVNLIDEGVDVAVRLGHLPESNLIAYSVGEVRRVICASPKYLAGKSPLRKPSDLQAHACIFFSQVTPNESWTFSGGPRGKGAQSVRLKPRLTVNTALAAIESCVEGHGVACVLSYQVEFHVAAGRLRILLEGFEPAPLPVHVVFQEARLAAAKTRAFVDMLVPALRRELSPRKSRRINGR